MTGKAKTLKERKASTIALAKAIKARRELSEAGKATLALLNQQNDTDTGRGATNAEADAVHGFDIKQLPQGKGRLYRRVKTLPHNPGPLPVIASDIGNANPEGRFERTNKFNTDKRIGQDASRQSVEKQIRAVKAHIADNIHRMKLSLMRNETDNVVRYCSVITRYHGLLMGLASKAAEIQAKDAEKAKEVQPRKSSLKVTVKAKRYARWSDNPKSKG